MTLSAQHTAQEGAQDTARLLRSLGTARKPGNLQEER